MAHLRGIETRLVKLKTDDGMMEMADYVRIGDVYVVFPETVAIRVYGNTGFPGRVWRRQAVIAWSERGGAGWMPTELFDVWNKEVH